MKKTSGALIIVVLLAASAAVYYFWQQSHAPAPRVLQPVETPPPVTTLPTTPPEAATHYPLPLTQQAPAAPTDQLPSLQQSDTAMRNALADLLGSQTLVKLFHMQGIVRRIVVTIDNLPRKTVAARLLPTQPVNGAFLTTGKDDDLAIAPDNAARYAPYVHAAEMVNTQSLIHIYVKFYPLFQQAYQDLGYPNGYFNDRLIEVIDHLLDAPEIEGPVALTQPHILYQFADPALEAESAGHKVLLRMGSDNEERIKVKLREIRHALTSADLKH